MKTVVRAATVVTLTLLAGAARLGAQQAGVVAGQVVIAGTQSPISDVQIRLEGTGRGAASDAAGRFRIVGVSAGEYTLVAQRVGLAAERRTVTVTAGESVQVNLAMTEAPTVVAPAVVSATREIQRRTEASATIEVLDGAEVRRVRATHPSGIMNRVPGVHVSDLSGEGHSMAIRQPITTKPMYLFLEDGIPTRATGFFNHNALYEVNIPQSGGVEVMKGPGTALYGSDAIGGVVNVLTRPVPASPSIELTAEGGAYGYSRVLASGGTSLDRHGFRADVNLTHGDSWKDDASFSRQSGTVRWDATGSGAWRARTVFTASNIEQGEVPALTQAQYDSAPGFNPGPIAFRKVQAVRVSSSLEREQGASLLSIAPFARYNVLKLLPPWQLTFDPQTWDTRNRSLGVLLKYRQDVPPIRARVIVGADADWSPGSFFARQAVTTRVNGQWLAYTDGEVHYDYDVTYKAVSPYLHAEFAPLPRLRADVGVRADFAGYGYSNNLTPLATGPHRRPASTSVRYSQVSPKLGISAELNAALNIYASYRQGFRAPSQGQLFQQNSAANTVDLKPVKVESWEVGLRGQPLSRMVYQLSAYDMIVRDDILVFRQSQTERLATNAGRTRHRGVEGSVGVALATRVRLDASYAITRQRYVEWEPQAGTSFAGNRMEVAPRELGNVLLTWSPRLLRGGRVAAEWKKTGSYALNPENTDFGGAYQLVHLHFNANVHPRAELFARVVNLFDEKYAEVLTRDPFVGRQYMPGAPRSLYAGLRYGWQR